MMTTVSCGATKLSKDGDYFFTIDTENILTCYLVDDAQKRVGDFLELQEDKRVYAKNPTWSLKPGGHWGRSSLRLLTVSAAGNRIGIVGRNGQVYFLDEAGQKHLEISCPGYVQEIGIADSAAVGYACGEHWIQIAETPNRPARYIALPPHEGRKAIVNFGGNKIFVLAEKTKLSLYDFAGNLQKDLRLAAAYHHGLSCAEAGIVLMHAHGLLGVSAQGRGLFKFATAERLSGLHHIGPWLLATTAQSTVIAVNLTSMQVTRKRLPAPEGAVRIVCLDPLLITAHNRLFHLQHDLSVVSAYTIQSATSMFYLEDSQLREIVRSQSGLRCYDEQGHLVWRFRCAEIIRDQARTKNGMVVSTDTSIYYIALHRSTASPTHLAQFLEI